VPISYSFLMFFYMVMLASFRGDGGAAVLACHALAADHAKPRAAYKDFLTLWKDAAPDIPILKEAKTEYAKLK
jgi:hypothetical protein